jgi:hypothetical protein
MRQLAYYFIWGFLKTCIREHPLRGLLPACSVPLQYAAVHKKYFSAYPSHAASAFLSSPHFAHFLFKTLNF